MALNFLNNGYFGGKLGIGTETPLGVLEVAENGGGTWTPTNKPTLFVSNAGTSNSYYALGIKSNSGDIFAVTNAGNVGIGETSVDARLHISALASNGISNVKLESPGASKWAFGIPASQTYFALDDVNDNLTTPRLVVLKTSGNVGIGTTSPAGRLHVSDTATLTAVYQKFTNGTTGHTSNDGTTLGIDSDGDFLINNNEAKEIKLYTSDTQRLTISSAGAVKFNTYNTSNNTGTPTYILGTDASGNVVKVLGGDIPGGGGTVTGSGTLNTIPLWTPDGDTLGNAPITISGNNSTFVGNVTLNSRLTFDYGGDHYFEAGTNTLAYKSSGGTSIMTLNASTNAATFAGNVTSNSTTGFTVQNAGSIGNTANDINIYSTTAGHNGLRMHANGILPTDNTGAIIDNDADLGFPTYRFKDLYLGGSITAGGGATFAGNVGIGATSPGAKLEVVSDVAKGVLINRTYATSSQTLSNVRAYYGLAITPMRSGGTGGLYFTNYDADTPIIQSVNTSDVAQFLLLNPLGGNVGIGTTSPDNTLDVVASDVNITPNAESSAVFRRNGNNYLTILSNASNEGGILFGNAVDANDGTISYKHNTQSMQFSTADAERMRITSSGNVGIGTTGPTSKLQVNYSAAPSFNANGGANALTLIRDDSGGDLNEVGAGLVFAQRYINTATASIGVGGIYGVKTIASGSFGGGLAFYTQPFGSGSMDRRMIINHAGAIQFNDYDGTNQTGTPTYLLGTDASGNVVKTNTVPGSGAGPYLPLSAGSSYPLTGGLYGTTASFSDQVDINGFTGDKGLSFRTGFTPTNVGIMAKAIGTANRDGIAIFGYNGIDMMVNNGNTVAMRIVGVTGSGMGNVGIGTTGPGRKLDIAGITRSSGFMNENNYIEVLPGGSLNFTNGVANQNYDIRLGNISFWGYIEVEITGTYSNQSTPGKLTKIYAVGVNPATSSAAGIIYANNPRVADALGPIKDNIALGDFRFDGTDDTGTFAIRISHIVSTGNAYTVKVRVFTHGSNGANGAGGIISNISISPIYTQTALSRNYVYYDDNVGIGTTQPSTGLDIQTSYQQLTLGNTSGSQAGAIGFRRGGDGQILGKIGFNGATDGNVFVAGLIGGGGSEFRLTSGNATSSVVTVSTASGEAMRVLGTNNNVGIGTTTPNTALQVNQNTTVPLLVHRPSNTSFDPHGIGFSTRNDAINGGLGDVRSGIFSDYNGDLFLAASQSSITTSPLSSSRLFIEGSNGNVGIGTTSPGQKLEVIGNISSGLSSTTTRTALIANTFGYSTSWKTLTLGSAGTNYQTDAVSLCFNVLLNQNSSGSFTGDGSEYFWRNIGSFKTPNSGNNGYNSILNWNSSGKILNLAPYNGITFADGQEAVDGAGQIIPPPGRSSSPDPEDYQRSFSTEFKGKTASGSPGTGGSWIGLISMSPYRPSTSGFYTTQLGFGADGTNGDMFIRRGTTTTWGSWDKFLTQGNSGIGPFLPLAGGTLTGALTGTSASFTGALSSVGYSGTSGTFSASVTASGNSNNFGNTTTAALTATSGTFTSSVTAAGNSNSFGATTLTGALAGTTATFSGLTTLETFPQTEPIRGEVYSIDPHKYVGGVGYWTWTKIAQLDATGHASLRYNCKADVNYPHVAVGWVTISSYDSSSISISHQQIIPSETIQPQIWLDNNRDVWIRMVNASWVTNFQYNWEVVDPNVATIYDGTTQSNTQPANSTVIEVGQEIKFPYTNAAAPVASATYIPVTTTGDILARNGGITLGGTGRIQGVDTVSATTDAANKAYVDAHGGGLGPFLPLAGGTLTGTTNMLLTLNPTTSDYGGILFQYGGVSKGSSIYNSGLMVYGGESGVDTRLQAGGQYGLHIDATNRNVHIGGTTDATYKLQVTGTTYTSGNAIFQENVSLTLASARLKLGADVGYGLIQRGQSSTGTTNTLYFGETLDTGATIFRGSGHTSFESNVGIGTTAPVSHSPNRRTLIINDTSDGSNMELWGTNSGKSIFQEVGGNSYVGKLVKGTGAGTLYLLSGDANYSITALSSGNVGIGITDPDQALEIGAGGKLKLSRADNSRSMLLYTNNADCVIESDTDPLHLQSANRMTFATNGTSEKMRITTDGNIGIGTTAPDLGGVAGTRVLTIASPTAERWGILELAGNRTWGGNQVGELKFISTDATNNGTLVSLTAVNDPTATGTGGSLKFNTRPDGGSLTERMVISSAGLMKFTNYGAGTLVTDASGNITASSGGGAGGPFLPLAGGTMDSGATISMSGNLTLDNSAGSTVITNDVTGGNIIIEGGFYAGTTASSSFDIHTKGAAKFESIPAATTDTDKFIVSDGGAIKFRTGTELLSDIGAAPATGGAYLPLAGGTMTGTINIPEYIVHVGDTDTKFGFTAANQFQVIAGGNTNLNVQGNGVDLSYAGSTRLNTQTGGIAITGELITTGDVGIGVTNPSAKLHVDGDSYFEDTVSIASLSSYAYLNIITSDAGNGNSGQGLMYLENTNAATSGGAMVLALRNNYGTGFGNYIKFFKTGGTTIGEIYANSGRTNVVYSTSSDYRLKEDLKTFKAVDIINQIPVYDFKWKETDFRDYGVLAHEMQAVLPGLVKGDKDGEENQTVDYMAMVPILMQSIKELKAEIELLKQNK